MPIRGNTRSRSLAGLEKDTRQEAGSGWATVRQRLNAGDELLELSGQAIPAGDLDRYLQAVFAVLDASPTDRPLIFYLSHVLWRHRYVQLITSPSQAIQRIIFPLILLAGRVLGKDRGSSWPGSPESCMGAPEVKSGEGLGMRCRWWLLAFGRDVNPLDPSDERPVPPEGRNTQPTSGRRFSISG